MCFSRMEHLVFYARAGEMINGRGKSKGIAGKSKFFGYLMGYAPEEIACTDNMNEKSLKTFK